MWHGFGYMKTLNNVALHFREQRKFFLAFYALGDYCQVEPMSQGNDRLDQAITLGTFTHLKYERDE